MRVMAVMMVFAFLLRNTLSPPILALAQLLAVLPNIAILADTARPTLVLTVMVMRVMVVVTVLLALVGVTL